MNASAVDVPAQGHDPAGPGPPPPRPGCAAGDGTDGCGSPPEKLWRRGRRQPVSGGGTRGRRDELPGSGMPEPATGAARRSRRLSLKGRRRPPDGDPRKARRGKRPPMRRRLPAQLLPRQRPHRRHRRRPHRPHSHRPRRPHRALTYADLGDGLGAKVNRQLPALCSPPECETAPHERRDTISRRSVTSQSALAPAGSVIAGAA